MVRASAHPNPNYIPNSSCLTCVHHKKITVILPLTKNAQDAAWNKKTSLIPNSDPIYLLTRCPITLPSKLSSRIPDSLLCIPSHLTQPMKHVQPCFHLVTALAYPPFILLKGLNQNPRWYTCDLSTQLTRVLQYRSISSKWPFAYLLKTRLVSFKTCFAQSSSSYSPPLSFDILFPSNTTLSRGLGVVRLHLVFILR